MKPQIENEQKRKVVGKKESEEKIVSLHEDMYSHEHDQASFEKMSKIMV